MRYILLIALIFAMAGVTSCSKGEKVELEELEPAEGAPAQVPDASQKGVGGQTVQPKPGEQPPMPADKKIQPSLERPKLVTPQGLPAPRLGSGQAQPAAGQPRATLPPVKQEAAMPGQAKPVSPEVGKPTAMPPSSPMRQETTVRPVPTQVPVQSLSGPAVRPAAKPLAEMPKQTPKPPVQPEKPAVPTTTPASAAPTVPVPPPTPTQTTLKPTVSPMKELETITPPTTNAPSPKVTPPPANDMKKELKKEEKKIEG